MRENIVKIEWNCKAADADGRKLSGGVRGGWSEDGEKKEEESSKNEKKL